MANLGAALVGLVVGAVLAWVKAALAVREKVHDDLRTHRLEVYPLVWRLTASLSIWPPVELTREDVLRLDLDLRAWYYTNGGLYLSETSRKRYGELKELMGIHLDRWDASAGLAGAHYKDLAETCSAFRVSLTEDLETRRQRSLWWVVVAWRRHRKARAEWKARKARLHVGDDYAARAYPLSEMPLPPVEVPASVEKPA